MKNKQATPKHRNPALIIVALILIAIGLVLLLVSALYVSQLGWWSLAIGASGLATIAAATMSIIENDPVWILLDLIIPG